MRLSSVVLEILPFLLFVFLQKSFVFIVKSGLCKTHSLPMNFFFFLLLDKPNHVLNDVG